jgi:hypothetical protein
MPNGHDQQQDALKEASAPYETMQVDGDIDLSLLQDSLRLTPWQRLVENNRALGLVRMLEQARIQKDGRPDQNP